MKPRSLFPPLLLLAAMPSALGQVIFFSDLNLAVPDGSYSGRASTQTVSGLAGTVADVNVTLAITPVGEGAFNGDLYVTLQHDSGYAVLLNRPGRRLGDSVGYADEGLAVTFDESSAAGDIHNYRLSLTGSHVTGVGLLTGSWATDGRETDPGAVLDTDLRTARLDSFHGLDPNGIWTLSVFDLVGGGTPVELTSWSLAIVALPVAVPEPAAALGLAGAVLLGFAALRRKIGKDSHRAGDQPSASSGSTP